MALDDVIDNSEDPVADERFPNIVACTAEDYPEEPTPCMIKTIEEVHDG